jgi:hypothetical protein
MDRIIELNYWTWIYISVTKYSNIGEYLENVLYRVIAGNLKIQNNPTSYVNADELVFDSGHG